VINDLLKNRIKGPFSESPSKNWEGSHLMLTHYGTGSETAEFYFSIISQPLIFSTKRQSLGAFFFFQGQYLVTLEKGGWFKSDRYLLFF
jgi:hypothetical protein